LAKALSSILLDIGGSYVKSAVIESGKNNFENLRLYPTPEFIDDKSKKRVIPTEELLRVIDAAIEVQLQYKPEAKRIFTSGQMGGYVVKTKKGLDGLVKNNQFKVKTIYLKTLNICHSVSLLLLLFFFSLATLYYNVNYDFYTPSTYYTSHKLLFG
jgi:hypothetical protein